MTIVTLLRPYSSEFSCAKVTVASKLTIPASTKIKIVAHIKSDTDGMELVVQDKSNPQTLYIARALVTTNNEIVPCS